MTELPPLFDTHVHLKDDCPDDNAFCDRAAEAGVSHLLFLGDGMAQCRRLANLAGQRDTVYFAVGVHPHESAEMKEDFTDYRREFGAHPRLAAIGEIGLDFYYDLSDEKSQIHVFSGFLQLALDMNLPASIHLRDKDGCDRVYQLAYDLLKPFHEAGGRYVLHAFAGTPDWMKKFLDIGAFFGVGGMLTFKRADNIRATVSQYPLDRVFLETDSPYLAPVPFRGQENHPMFLPYIAIALANLKGVSPQDIAATTAANAKAFFLRDDK